MKEAKLSFEIELPDSSVSVEEWRRAQSAPNSDLRPLSEEEKEVARKLGVTEESYARSVLAGEFGRRRMVLRAQTFGEYVAGILEELAAGAVDAVKSDPFRGRWLVRLRPPDSLVITVPRELVDDLLDSGRRPYLEQLRQLVKEQLAAVDEQARQ